MTERDLEKRKNDADFLREISFQLNDLGLEWLLDEKVKEARQLGKIIIKTQKLAGRLEKEQRPNALERYRFARFWGLPFFVCVKSALFGGIKKRTQKADEEKECETDERTRSF